jgi:hypothetical protein
MRVQGEAEDQTARWMLFNIRRKRKAPNTELEEGTAFAESCAQCEADGEAKR